MVSDYSGTIPALLSDLTEAGPDVVKHFYRGLNTALCIMANHNDAEAIDAVLNLYPEMLEHLDCEEASPLVCAIRSNAFDAFDALLNCGVSVENCGNQHRTTIELVLGFFFEGTTSLEMLRYLIDCQAKVSFVAVIHMFFRMSDTALVKEILLQAIDVGASAELDPDEMLECWDEVLKDQSLCRDITEYMQADHLYSVDDFRPFLESCRINLLPLQPASNASKLPTEDARAKLHAKLLADAEERITMLRSKRIPYLLLSVLAPITIRSGEKGDVNNG